MSEKCVLCNGTGFMPVVSKAAAAELDAPIDAIAEETVRRIMHGIPQGPSAPLGPSLASRSDAEEIHEFLIYELGSMLGKMTVAKLKAMGWQAPGTSS